MPNESSVTKFERVVRGRNLIILAATDVVLFVLANVAYGAGGQHGLRNGVSNVAWALFLARESTHTEVNRLNLARSTRLAARSHHDWIFRSGERGA